MEINITIGNVFQPTRIRCMANVNSKYVQDTPVYFNHKDYKKIKIWQLWWPVKNKKIEKVNNTFL